MRHLDYSFMLDSLKPIVLKGVPISLSIAIVAFIFGCVIGLAIAVIKLYNVPILNPLATLYTSFFRGTPLLVQILVSYYGFPILIQNVAYLSGQTIENPSIPTIVFLYIVYSLNTAAYLSEYIRGAIISVDKGQIEAGLSIGMSPPRTFRRIVLPQAFRIALPSLGNSIITLTKNTSIAFVVAVPDIIGQAKIIAGRSMKFFEAYIVAALVYWVICIICEIIVNRVEIRSSKYERSAQ